jgi:dynactin 6
VCQDVDMKGDITIGAGTIVHPKATIFAAQGPIIIGSGCIVEEGTIILNRCVVVCLSLRCLMYHRRKEVMRIGDDNLFEIGCRKSASVLSIARIESYSGVECPMGNFNTICTRARVHYTTRLSSYCVIGAGCLVVATEEEILDEYTVIHGPVAERRVWSGRGRVQEVDLRRKHAEYLREMLPKFNRLRRGDGA